jgi:Flp pilus assembly protein TadD
MILAISLIAARGSGQSLDQADDPSAGFNNGGFNARGVPGIPSSNCRDPLTELPIACHQNWEPLDMGLTETPALKPKPAGMVSADELRSPLSGKAERSLRKAQSLIQSGDRSGAIAKLREATEIPSAKPYAYSLLGQELLRSGDVKAALPELEQAVQLLPNNVADRANLGLALLMSGDVNAAEGELRRALQLDPKNLQTKLVLGMTMLRIGSHDEEAVDLLVAAAPRCPSAHVLLAAFYARSGRLDAAEKEGRAFLGPAVSSDPAVVHNWVASIAKMSLDHK